MPAMQALTHESMHNHDHAQTEKQRIIWAYKILFLDVLFPLSVERIIFVDSDQVGASSRLSFRCRHSLYCLLAFLCSLAKTASSNAMVDQID